MDKTKTGKEVDRKNILKEFYENNALTKFYKELNSTEKANIKIIYILKTIIETEQDFYLSERELRKFRKSFNKFYEYKLEVVKKTKALIEKNQNRANKLENKINSEYPEVTEELLSKGKETFLKEKIKQSNQDHYQSRKRDYSTFNNLSKFISMNAQGFFSSRFVRT
jgi:hypothetical protein